MNEYTCYTNRASWKFYAEADFKDAMRVALFYCWRDDEIFDHIVTPDGKTLRICSIDKNNSVQTIK